MKITKDLLRTLIKEQIEEAFGMEQDFKPGMPVQWSELKKVFKKTASGREKVDYERVPMTGVILKVEMDRFSTEPGFAVVDVDGQDTPAEVDLTELTLLGQVPGLVPLRPLRVRQAQVRRRARANYTSALQERHDPRRI